MKRTQLYIDEGLFHRLSVISREKKTTISNLVRRAIEKVYGRLRSKEAFLKALQESAGLWKDRDDLPPTQEYIRSLRKGTRGKRFGLS
jgi:hypothetical protein